MARLQQNNVERCFHQSCEQPLGGKQAGFKADPPIRRM